ncbi:GNAT family N-acetyltransferase [Neolewinella aurantiaca]|uniref:GNAT family N-acetyltransferase n=1 Tax=Neolewinella aurantiaca TaxID=2602767 RepID=A0A5C7FK74_9BACT|nr:GNAT family N-acetyltransferase [Neolewinella aurantiaca]TXF86684.1 GNAT family N-acetyltransferase [Neolewinella aurantiaca]
MSIQIRQATINDVPALHRLVGELAEYVGERQNFTATVATYEEDFRDGFYKAVVAEDEGTVIGMALYYFTYSTWKGRMIYLEDFVLSPAYRRRGIGQRLWDVLLERGREKKCQLLKWQVVDTNTEAMKFYAAQQSIMEENWINGKLYL